MVVSMLQFIIELPETTSLKEKRHIVNSLKHRIIRRYKVSAAEVDLHESIAFAQIGVAVVSNSRKFGESLMQKILSFAENDYEGRVHDSAIFSENYQ
jgi:uncharacterized protein YlxP (DUF503 family)